jgi:transposase
MRPTGSSKELERRRLQAMALLDKGMSGVEVAEAVGATPGAVSQWKKRYQRAGPDALRAKPHPGPEPKLTAPQRKRLARMLRQGARKHGYPTELWTLKRIGELIERHFEVTYEQSGVWRLLQAMGWSGQKPERRARERDDDAIAQWRAQDWPRIKKSAAKRS